MRSDCLSGFLFHEVSGACRSLSVEVGGVLFCCFLQPLHDSLATENDCSGNDGAGKVSWCIKKLQFLLFLGGN